MSINMLLQIIHKGFLMLNLFFLPSFKCHDKVIYQGGETLTVELYCDTTWRSNTSVTNNMQFFLVPATSLSVKIHKKFIFSL